MVRLWALAALTLTLVAPAPAGAQTRRRYAHPARSSGGRPSPRSKAARSTWPATGVRQACLIWRQGGVMECFRTVEALDAREPSWRPAGAATPASAPEGPSAVPRPALLVLLLQLPAPLRAQLVRRPPAVVLGPRLLAEPGRSTASTTRPRPISSVAATPTLPSTPTVGDGGTRGRRTPTPVSPSWVGRTSSPRSTSNRFPGAAVSPAAAVDRDAVEAVGLRAGRFPRLPVRQTGSKEVEPAPWRTSSSSGTRPLPGRLRRPLRRGGRPTPAGGPPSRRRPGRGGGHLHHRLAAHGGATRRRRRPPVALRRGPPGSGQPAAGQPASRPTCRPGSAASGRSSADVEGQVVAGDERRHRAGRPGPPPRRPTRNPPPGGVGGAAATATSPASSGARSRRSRCGCTGLGPASVVKLGKKSAASDRKVRDGERKATSDD